MRLTLSTPKGQFVILLGCRGAEWCAVITGELAEPQVFGNSTAAGHYGPVEIFGSCPTSLTGRAVRHVEYMAGDILRWEMESAEQETSTGMNRLKAGRVPAPEKMVLFFTRDRKKRLSS